MLPGGFPFHLFNLRLAALNCNTLLDKSPGRFLAFFGIEILKHDLTVYTQVILRGGKI